MDLLDQDACHRALQTRDARFDGRLFVGVTSTGIYCRPICRAGPAKRENCRFFPSAAAAQEAGFRPCLRCRPETAPDLGAWRGTSNTVSRGLALIAEGALDGEDANVEALATRLGVGGRQLRRLFKQHLGASPLAVAQTRRVLFAKQLIHDTRLPMAEIAMAAGFGSVRRFNETFQHLFRRPPSALRRKSIADLPEGSVAATGVTVELRYRPPYDWSALLTHLRERARDDVEEICADSYRRRVSHGGDIGDVEVIHAPARLSLVATIRFPNLRALPAIVARIRRRFDLGADVGAIGAHLAADSNLAPLIAARPGLRAPGEWNNPAPDAHESDRFPADDANLMTAAQRVFDASFNQVSLLARARAWSPWRAYAAQHLWAYDADAQSSAASSRAPSERGKATSTPDESIDRAA